MALPLVLHVLPVDLFRGAQVYARELREQLDGVDARHRTLTIFHSDGGALRPDDALDLPSGLMRRAGLDPRAVLALRRVLQSDPPAVVVAHGGEPLKYAVLAGVPQERLVYYKIGVGRLGRRGARARLYRFLLGRARVTAVVSDDAAEQARSLGVPDRRVVVIANGRDPNLYRATERSEPEGPVRLAFVGHLTESKRPERFIQLVRALRSEGLSVHGTLAGDGPLQSALSSSDPDPDVSLAGRVDDVPAFLAASDIFVFTSVAAGEGMPGVLIEAGLAGLPVVTTRVPGAADVVEDGQTGMVVPIDDFDALVDSTRALVVDAGLRRRMGASARQRCADRFSLEASVRQWRTLFGELFGELCASST